MRSEEDRFFDLVSPRGHPNGCWLWLGATYRKGYGHFRRKINGKWVMYKAHRYSYKYFYGKLSENQLVLHICDNPPCVNPNHLFVGTHKDNSEDCVKKGRHKWGIHSKINSEIAEKIRASVGTNAVVGKLFNISATEVSYIKNNKRWKQPAGGL